MADKQPKGRHGLICLSCAAFKPLTGKEALIVKVCGACGGPMVEGWEKDRIATANASKREHGHPLIKTPSKKRAKKKESKND